MENLSNQTLRSTLFIFAVIFFLSKISANIENYEQGWSYDPWSPEGPEHWGDLKEEWADCKYGKKQSPIALARRTAKFNRDLGRLNRNHRTNFAALINSGHDVSVVWGGNAGSIQINGTYYYLQNFHWHHPSEHTVNGKRFALELHMVHSNDDPNLSYNKAVVAVLYQLGKAEPFLRRLENDIKELDIHGGEIWLGKVNPERAAILSKQYYRYMGSLTTPPCSQDVIWTVNEQISTVSRRQVELLKGAVVEEKNARPLQKINGRDIFYYDPMPREIAAE